MDRVKWTRILRSNNGGIGTFDGGYGRYDCQEWVRRGGFVKIGVFGFFELVEYW